MWASSQKTTDLIRFTEEILNEKVHFLLNENSSEYAYEKIRI